MTRRIPEEVAASEADILAAIEALTTEESPLRLRAYARFRAGMLRKAGLDKGDEDLLQIALKSLLSDRRRWNKNSNNFVDFMLGAIKSISNNWCRTLDPNEPDLEADSLGWSTQCLEIWKEREVTMGDSLLERVRNQRQSIEELLQHLRYPQKSGTNVDPNEDDQISLSQQSEISFHDFDNWSKY